MASAVEIIKGHRSYRFLDPAGWDLVKLGGIAIPGKCRITGGGLRLKEDRKERNGGHGGFPTFTGLEAQTFSLRIVYVDADRERMGEFLALVNPNPGSAFAGQPQDIEAKALELLQSVTSVVVIGCSFEVQTEDGEYEITLTLRHWLPQAAQKHNAKAGKDKPATVSPPAVRNVVDEQIQGISTVRLIENTPAKPIEPSKWPDNFAP